LDRKEPDWRVLIPEIFKAFLKLRSYQATTRHVNKFWHDLLPKPLKRHQVEAIITNPVYCGRPRYSDKAVVEDPALAYVDIKTFEEAQLISAAIRKRHARKKEDALSVLMKLHGAEVLDFIPKVAVQCRTCGGIMTFNGTVNRAGWVIRIYKCKCQSQRLVPTKAEIRNILEWASKQDTMSPKPISTETSSSRPKVSSLPRKAKISRGRGTRPVVDKFQMLLPDF
jgi:hypothetical protein